MTWTTPDDLRAQLERLWARGSILSATVTGEALFPRRLPLRRPDRRDLADRFGEVRAWIQALENASKIERGFGYEIVWTEVNHRQVGRNRLPSAITIPTEQDALRLIGKQKAADRFRAMLQATERELPVLKVWLARRPLTALELADDWPEVLAVVAWFRDNPQSGLYLRQVDIAGVDTKFIEARKGLLSELTAFIPAAAEGAASGAASFERMHGLRAKPALVRFRVLDPRLAIRGLRDLTVPVAELAGLDIAPARVFVTENEINGLAFPSIVGGIVIFGLGYGVELLSEVAWLAERPLHYWGDIDTHGLAILDRLRERFPHAQALLMDRPTLLGHRELWGREPAPYKGELMRLRDEERALYDDLRSDRFGPAVRLEQERIRYGWIRQVMTDIL
ncbi:MAG: hypothetical protein BroJett024_36450 [Alphaproteobacteria bacterium]|nr:MAG: hypothetical protein BroJett024_36450 [Alphaproteobacteria bacterium]